MTSTIPEPNATSTGQTDRERFGDILAAQRAAYLRDGAPTLTQRRSDLKKFKAALLARRDAIEEAINTDFGNRSRHETAMMEILGVVQGISYLDRNLRRFMRRPTDTSPCRCVSAATASNTSRSAWSASSRRGTTPSTCH
jgi:acyl-CoA reductase-like NAD-dependent aldehyde dehydrogenase